MRIGLMVAPPGYSGDLGSVVEQIQRAEADGFDWSHPIRHMREYLTCLNQLLSGEPTSFAGEEFRIEGHQLTVTGGTPPPILVAALGPQMLRLTGRLADGTAVWMGGQRYLE